MAAVVALLGAVDDTVATEALGARTTSRRTNPSRLDFAVGGTTIDAQLVAVVALLTRGDEAIAATVGNATHMRITGALASPTGLEAAVQATVTGNPVAIVALLGPLVDAITAEVALDTGDLAFPARRDLALSVAAVLGVGRPAPIIAIFARVERPISAQFAG